MADPRNIAHDKTVALDKQHAGKPIVEDAAETVQPGKKPTLEHHAKSDKTVKYESADKPISDPTKDKSIKSKTSQLRRCDNIAGVFIFANTLIRMNDHMRDTNERTNAVEFAALERGFGVEWFAEDAHPVAFVLTVQGPPKRTPAKARPRCGRPAIPQL